MATLMASQVQSRRALPRLRKSESLSAILSQAGPLPEEQVWSVVDQLLQYLETTHQQGRCHRCFSLTTIGIDAAGELEIAASEAPFSISELVRLHSPLPSCLRHEFDLVLPPSTNDASIALAHAGFGGDGVALDLFQVAVLTIRLVFDVDGERFLASPCLQETLSPDLCRLLRGILSTDRQIQTQAKLLRAHLPGAEPPPSEPVEPEAELETPLATEVEISASPEAITPIETPSIATEATLPTPLTPLANEAEAQHESLPLPVATEATVSPNAANMASTRDMAPTPPSTSGSLAWLIAGAVIALLFVGGLVTAVVLNMEK